VERRSDQGRQVSRRIASSRLVVRAAGLLLAFAAAGCSALAPSAAPGQPVPGPTAAPPDPAVVAAHLRDGLPLFAYDPSAAITVNVTPDAADGTATATVSEMTYMGANGSVTALLVVPTSAGPHPGLVLLSGLPGTRRDLLPRALDLANAGVVSLLIDAPHARASRVGPGTQPINLTTQDRDEQIQLIGDLRRAITVLALRSDVDDHAIGFLGASYGASIGGLLAGVEPRLAASVLESGDGGLVSHFAALGDASPLAGLTPAARDAWIAAMDPIEPLYFVGNAAGPVLFQAGEQDTVAQPAEQARFAAAGNARSSVTWYDTGHGLSEPAWCDAAKFLGDELGFDGSQVTVCGGSAPSSNAWSWVAIIGLFVVVVVVRLVVRLRRRRPPPPKPGAGDDDDEDEAAHSRPIIRPPRR
jgi:dienelactone hydrolase